MTDFNPKIGNFIKVNNTLGEVISLTNGPDSMIVIKTAHKTLEGMLINFLIEPVPLQREMLIESCGFDGDGTLKINIKGRDFYLQEKQGHIILLGKDAMPLIHFWDVKYLHLLQNLYYALIEQHLPVDAEQLKKL